GPLNMPPIPPGPPMPPIPAEPPLGSLGAAPPSPPIIPPRPRPSPLKPLPNPPSIPPPLGAASSPSGARPFNVSCLAFAPSCAPRPILLSCFIIIFISLKRLRRSLTAAARDATAAAHVEDVGLQALARRHRREQRLEPVHLLVVDVDAVRQARH